MRVDTSIGQSVARMGDPRMAIFIDDVFAILPARQAWVEREAFNQSGLVCGRMCNFLKEKCVWDLRQALEWTGWVIDLAEFQISIPESE